MSARHQGLFLSLLAVLLVMTSIAGCATGEQEGTPAQQAAQSGDDVETHGLPRVRPQMQLPQRAPAASPAPPPACCKVSAIDAKSGVVTARRSDGSPFQFQVTDARLLATLKIGQAVWLDSGGVVSLEGAPNCCKLVVASQPPVSGAVGLGVTVPQTTAQAPAVQPPPFGPLRQAEPPDLAIQNLSLKDCATRGLATAGKPVCAEIGYSNESGVVMSPWEVQCTMDSLVRTAPGHFPKRQGPGILNVDFGVVAPGARTLSCTVDSRNQVVETNKNNNSKSAQVTVLVPGYDLAITAIGSTVIQVRIPPYGARFARLVVTLASNGTETIPRAAASCRNNSDSLMFTSRGAYTVDLRPGESRAHPVLHALEPSGDLPPRLFLSGPESVSCTAQIVGPDGSPSGVTETYTANNTLTGQVMKATPSYDIAITAIGSTLKDGTPRYGYGTLLEVTVTNNRDPIYIAWARCALGAVTFESSDFPQYYETGQSHTLTLMTATPLFQIPSGGQNVSCTAWIYDPSGVTERNTANNSMIRRISIPPLGPLDLTIRTVSLKDCATRRLATSGNSVCAEIEYSNESGVVTSPWEVQCMMDDVTKTAPGHFPKYQGPGILNVDFGNVTAGTRMLSCTLDPRNQIAETNKKNNSMSAQVAVLVPVFYDVAITAIGSTVTQSSYVSQQHRIYVLRLPVTLANNSNQTIRASARCRIVYHRPPAAPPPQSTKPQVQAGKPPPSVTLPQTFTWNFSGPSAEYKPGESRTEVIQAPTNPGTFPSGPQSAQCQAFLGQLPSGEYVTDGNPGNNTLTGTVSK